MTPHSSSFFKRNASKEKRKKEKIVPWVMGLSHSTWSPARHISIHKYAVGKEQKKNTTLELFYKQ
jgi:hypothetical protein